MALVTASAGTATLTESFHGVGQQGIHDISIAWTSNASGVVTATITGVSGYVERVITNPDGTDAPTDDYDITITDRDGLDILATEGGNRDTTNSEHVIPFLGDGTTTDKPVLTVGTLTLNISNAGDSKEGVIRLLVRRV